MAACHRGVETIAVTNSSLHFPTTTIALSLVGGFTVMLLVERVIHRYAPDSHSHAPLPTSESNGNAQPSISRVEFDVELGELEREEGVAASGRTALHEEGVVDRAQAWPLTLGLMVHALADGFALGSSATSPVDRGLSITVFLALIVHKGKCAILHSTLSFLISLPFCSASSASSNDVVDGDIPVALRLSKTRRYLQRIYARRSTSRVRPPDRRPREQRKPLDGYLHACFGKCASPLEPLTAGSYFSSL